MKLSTYLLAMTVISLAHRSFAQISGIEGMASAVLGGTRTKNQKYYGCASRGISDAFSTSTKRGKRRSAIDKVFHTWKKCNRRAVGGIRAAFRGFPKYNYDKNTDSCGTYFLLLYLTYRVSFIFSKFTSKESCHLRV